MVARYHRTQRSNWRPLVADRDRVDRELRVVKRQRAMPRLSCDPTVLLTMAVLAGGVACGVGTAPDTGSFTLTISVEGAGDVQYVNSQGESSKCGAPGSLDAPHECTARFPPGTSVAIQRTSGLSDLAEAQTRLDEWGGACAGVDAEFELRGGVCHLVMDENMQVTVAFEDRVLARVAHFLGSMVQVRWDLDYAPRPQKGGGNPLTLSGVFDCPWSSASPACVVEAWFDRGTLLTINVEHAGNGTAFDEWGGACSGEEHTCTVTLDRDVNAIVVFWGFAQATFATVTPAVSALVAGGDRICLTSQARR